MAAIQETRPREPSSEQARSLEHPLIAKTEIEIRSALQLSPEGRLRARRIETEHPDLIPNPADQGLILTPFDKFDGMTVAIPPDEHIEGWEITRRAILELANSPKRIEAMKKLEAQGFRPPKKIRSRLNFLGLRIQLPFTNGVIDKMIKRGVIPQLSDLGHNVDVLDGNRNSPQVHRADIFNSGPFSFVGRHVRSFVNLGAMPDINGSVLMLKTAARMHMLAEVPEVGAFSDPNKQRQLANAVLESLNENDPLLEGKSPEDVLFMLNHWRSNVVGVLEVGKTNALLRAEKLAEVGVKSFRVYGHSVGSDVIDTVTALRREHPKAEIFASQITSMYTAKACEEAGADAIIIGVGSGGRCTTAERSQLIPSNAVLAWRLRGEIGIPVIGEGGAVDEVVNAILVGMSGVNGSGSIGGGTFEAPGGLYFLTKDGKSFLKPYGGEASSRTKHLSKRTYSTGLPFFPEGEQAFKEMEPYKESMTTRMIEHWERIVLGAVILGVNDGPFTIPTIQNLDPSPLFEKSPTTQRLQEIH